MELQALQVLKLEEKSPPRPPRRVTLDTDNLAGWRDEAKEHLPLVYLLHKTDLGALRNLPEFHDCQEKDARACLSRYLLRKEKIPIIEAQYQSSRKCLHGIGALLDQAWSEAKLYVVGLEGKIFADLWNSSLEAAPGGKAQPKGGAGGSEAWDERAAAALDLSPKVEVPWKLRKEYLGNSAAAQAVRQDILLAAKNDMLILILGDTGTGKNIVAEQIHQYSARASKPLKQVNCGAIPFDLFESIMFGHRKGSFTTALEDRNGLWREAHEGTIFLDEIGDIHPLHQVKILHAVETGKIRPVGASEEIEVDARVIAATNRDLQAMKEAGQFREDLYYRLAGFFIRTPALRDHPADIPLLANHFWKKITGNTDQALPEEILAGLRKYSWPGNVRELRMVLNRLHGRFYDVSHLALAHLQYVFDYDGRPAADDLGAPSPRRSRVAFPLECARHLSQVQEVLGLCDLDLRQMAPGGQKGRFKLQDLATVLQNRLIQLNVLCAYPRRFHTPAVYDRVTGLKSKLEYFCSLLLAQDRGALEYWRKAGSREFPPALEAVNRELASLSQVY